MTDSPPRPTRAARNTALLLIAVMALAAVSAIWLSHQSSQEEAERLLSALTRAAAYQASDSLHSVDTIMRDAAERVVPGQPSAPGTAERLMGLVRATPEVIDIIVADRDGRVAAPALVAGPVIGTDISDSDYFRFQREHFREDQLRVAPALVSRVSGQLVIPASRPVRAADGSFAGIVAVGMNPQVFTGILSSVNDQRNGSAKLVMADGTILAATPATDMKHVGSDVAAVVAGRSFTIERRIVANDRSDRFIGIRALTPYPLAVDITLDARQVMAPWRLEAAHAIAAFAIFSLAVFLMALRSDRREDARARLAAGLESQVAERTRHLAAARAESRLRAEHLAASNAELEQFAYVASHDLREPLRMITSYLQLLQRKYQGSLDQDAHDFIGFAVDGATRMNRLIIDLLEFSRAGRRKEKHEVIPLAPVVATAIKNLETAIAESGARISVEGCDEARIEGDGDTLVRLFQNLIGNALKYRHPDRVPEIGVTARRRESAWEVAVADNGIGIEPQYFERIFLIFQRLHGRGEIEGTGIGLALAKKIVENHRGSIRVESVPGQGSTFRVTLPGDAPA